MFKRYVDFAQTAFLSPKAKSGLDPIFSRNRGVKDILIACVDGLKGFPEAIEAVYPATQVQLCIVHMVRHSLNYVSWKQRKEMANDLKEIYRAATVEQAEANLATFGEKWDATHPRVSQVLAEQLAANHPVFCLPAGDSPGDLHDQYH